MAGRRKRNPALVLMGNPPAGRCVLRERAGFVEGSLKYRRTIYPQGNYQHRFGGDDAVYFAELGGQRVLVIRNVNGRALWGNEDEIEAELDR